MIRQSFKMAWKSIISNKMRSFLTMLGIIIGVMSLVVLVSLTSGTTDSVNQQISSLGSNLLTVRVSDDKGNPLKLEDLEQLAEEEEIEALAPVAQTNATASGSFSEETATIYGTTSSYAEIQNLNLAYGRFLKNTDIDNHTNVVVINAGLARQVLGRMNVVGETIKLKGSTYTIIGVLEADENDSTTTENYEAYIPYTSLIRLTDDVSSDITTFYASATSDQSLDQAENVLNQAMMSRFSQDEDAFTIINQSTIMEAMSNVTNTLQLLLGGIAMISLIVGGIGIMNIMLVSVTERTREIGIRKAIGASHATILLQFLIEALVLSLMGCIIGIAGSWIAIEIASLISTDANYSISIGVVLLSVLFSLAIGVIFGLYPANKAAKKKPIEALRFS